MEVNKETNEEVSNVESTEAEAVEGAAQAEEVQPQAPVVEQYQPNFTYEFRTLEGVREKKEFDERLKSIIKTKEDEEFIRQLVTKADGLDVNKRNLTQAQEQMQSIQKDYESMKNDVDFVLSARDRGDVMTALQAIGFSKKQLQEAVYYDLEAEKLTPQQKNMYNRAHELETTSYQANRKIQELESKVRSFEVQSRQAELESIISQNDIAPIAQEFDRRNGDNAFWNEVVQRGLMYATQFGVEKKPKEVVQEVIEKYNLRAILPQPKTQSAPKNLPVLPNTGASSSSVPLRQNPKSLKELRDFAKNLED